MCTAKTSQAEGPVSFEQILRGVAAGREEAWRPTDQLRKVALRVPLVAEVESSGANAPLGAAIRAYLEVTTHAVVPCQEAIMHAAVRHLELDLADHSISVDQIRRRRRVVAAIVHPDLYQGKDKIIAEALMKKVNTLFAAAVRLR